MAYGNMTAEKRPQKVGLYRLKIDFKINRLIDFKIDF